MPLHIKTTGQFEARDDLIRELAHEFNSPGASPFGEPLILVDETPTTNSSRITVIWDRWSHVPEELRSDIISEAYRQSRGTQTGFDVRLALGLTRLEAADAGLLPYMVIAGHDESDTISLAEYERVVNESGAKFPSDLPVGGTPNLVFATDEDAKAACLELQRLLPGSRWIIRDFSGIEGAYFGRSAY
jgi:hypothetical protein